MIVQGVIEFLETKDQNKYGKHTIKVNGDYYRSKFPAKGVVGDTVEFDDMDKKWINQLKVVSAGGSGGAPAAKSSAPRAPGFPVGFDTKDRSIVRQNSLTHATAIATAVLDKVFDNTTMGSFDDVKQAMTSWAEATVEIARTFEDYSAGDADYRAAKETLAEDK